MKSASAAAHPAGFEIGRRPPSWWGGLLHFARSKPLGAAGGVIVLIAVVVALLAGIIAPFPPNDQHYAEILKGPGTTYLLGTDNFGRDILSRIIYGSRNSLAIGIVSATAGVTIGALFGLVTGYLGGKVDLMGQRFIDVLMAFPVIILAMAVIAALGNSMPNVIMAIALALIPQGTRIVRSAALAVRESQFIEAAHAVGASQARIIAHHILPNCVAPYIITLTTFLASAIIIEASLSFLGLGMPPPDPSWGSMLSFEGRQYLERAPWIGIFPGIAVSLVVFGFNMLGDALRDVLDPRMRR